MPLTQLAPPYPIFTDKNGDPLDAGFLYFGVLNQNPETQPIQVYYDSAFTQPAAQPIRTINGYPSRNGSPAAIYTDQYFSITVRNKKNELVIYAPSGYGITPGTSASFADQITYNEGSAGAIDRSLTSRLQDYVSVNDFPDLQTAITAAMAGNFVIGVSADTTVRVPTDAPTLQDAFDHVTPLNAQCQIDVLIEAGHQPASGVSVADGDFGQWSISSVSATVILDAAFTGRFINSDNAHAPTLNTYVIAHSGVDRIYSLFGSIGKVNPNCGGEGTSGKILYGNASNIQAGQTIWKNHGDSIYFSAGSAVQLGGFTSDGATVTANGALTASRGSSIEAAGCTIKNCWFAVECKRAGSSINMHDSTIDTIGRIGIRATRGATVSFDGGSIVDLAPNATGAGIEVYGATISAGTGVSISYTSQALTGNYAIRASNAGSITCDSCTVDNASVAIYATTGGRISSSGSTITNARNYGVQCRQGSHITVSSATVTGSGTNDLRVTEGGIIAASGCTTSNGVGSPNVIDTNLDGFGGLNAFGASGRGIIFA